MKRSAAVRVKYGRRTPLLVMRSNQGYYTRSHQNSEVKRLWAGIVLGWVTSREVPVLHPLLLLSLSLFFFFFFFFFFHHLPMPHPSPGRRMGAWGVERQPAPEPPSPREAAPGTLAQGRVEGFSSKSRARDSRLAGDSRGPETLDSRPPAESRGPETLDSRPAGRVPGNRRRVLRRKRKRPGEQRKQTKN
jgi:hypothetical protein